jgi:lipoprotein signal peptidase
MTLLQTSPEIRSDRAQAADPAGRRQVRYLIIILVSLVSVDQITKAWAWRNLTQVHVNSGGDMFVNPVVSGWYRSPVPGAAFDVADAALLVVVALLLIRRRRPAAVLGFGALALGGWSSNLADRLLMHYWTAPGSVRGVVDFIPWDGRYWNVADGSILLGTCGFVASSVIAGLRALVLPPRIRRSVRRPFADVWGRCTLAVALGTATVLATIGVITYAGVSSPVSLATGG